MKTPRRTWWLTALALTSGILLVEAKPEKERVRQEAPPAPREAGRDDLPSHRSPGPAPLRDLLQPEQRVLLRDTLAAQREKERDIQERLRDLQREGARLSLAGGDNQEKLRRIADEIGELERNRALSRAKTLSRLGKSLTPDQRERLLDRLAGLQARRAWPALPWSEARPFRKSPQDRTESRPQWRERREPGLPRREFRRPEAESPRDIRPAEPLHPPRPEPRWETDQPRRSEGNREEPQPRDQRGRASQEREDKPHPDKDQDR